MGFAPSRSSVGMSPTAEREEQVDFTECYYNSNLVVIYKAQG